MWAAQLFFDPKLLNSYVNTFAAFKDSQEVVSRNQTRSFTFCIYVEEPTKLSNMKPTHTCD